MSESMNYYSKVHQPYIWNMLYNVYIIVTLFDKKGVIIKLL